jgi:hypothetical protein
VQVSDFWGTENAKDNVDESDGLAVDGIHFEEVLDPFTTSLWLCPILPSSCQ